MFLPAHDIELFEPIDGAPAMGFREFQTVAPEFGARVGYYPLRVLGLEVEGGAMPSQTTTDQQATLYHARGHLLAQLPRWSVVPFVVAGPTGLGVASDRSSVGDDIDLGFHFGGGVKVFVNRWTMLRLDARDTLTAQRGLGQGVVHSLELLAGFSITLGRAKPAPAPVAEVPTSSSNGFPVHFATQENHQRFFLLLLH